MERVLRKSAIYGFLVGVGLAILFVDYKQVTHLNGGTYETVYLSIPEYIITVLKFGVGGICYGLLGGWIIGNKNRYKEKEYKKTYYVEVFFAVFILTVLLEYIINWQI